MGLSTQARITNKSAVTSCKSRCKIVVKEFAGKISASQTLKASGVVLRKGGAHLFDGHLPEVARELLAMCRLHVRSGGHAVHQRYGGWPLLEVFALVPQEGGVVDVCGVQTCTQTFIIISFS
jgi:hypothetical protein